MPRATSGGSGGTVGLKPSELGRDVGADEIGTQAQHLSELDECRSELDGSATQSFARREAREGGIGEMSCDLDAERSRIALGPAREAVPAQHGHDPVETLAVFGEGFTQLVHRGLRRRRRCDGTRGPSPSNPANS
jgi:hypothetical protein